MLKEQVLKEFFIIKSNAGWTSFKMPSGSNLSGFGTRRIAKSTDGKHIVFTIGETQKGKGARLNKTIKTIIADAGLSPYKESSSNGTRIYIGFDLNAVSDHQLREILQSIVAAIASIA
jgi:glucose/arabinose dehydrogenase